MKKSIPEQQISRFSKAAFRIGAASFRGQRLNVLLDEVLVGVFGEGGGGSTNPSGCKIGRAHV